MVSQGGEENWFLKAINFQRGKRDVRLGGMVLQVWGRSCEDTNA